MVVRVGRGGVAGRIGLHPLDAVLHELPHGAAALVRAVDDEHDAFHPDLPELGVPVHQPAGATNLAAARSEARAEDEVFVDRTLEPDVDVVEAAAAPRGRVAAL